jgi:hypothetical protein
MQQFHGIGQIVFVGLIMPVFQSFPTGSEQKVEVVAIPGVHGYSQTITTL